MLLKTLQFTQNTGRLTAFQPSNCRKMKYKKVTWSSIFKCFEKSFTAWHSFVNIRKPLQIMYEKVKSSMSKLCNRQPKYLIPIFLTRTSIKKRKKFVSEVKLIQREDKLKPQHFQWSYSRSTNDQDSWVPWVNFSLYKLRFTKHFFPQRSKHLFNMLPYIATFLIITLW